MSSDAMERLAACKRELDEAIQQHIVILTQSTQKQYTDASTAAVASYTQLLGRGGKRIRGALTMLGYEMCGGQNHDMIVQAACAIEMVHAYVLLLDDIMDKSLTRRGGPTAHVFLADFHASNNYNGDSQHFGVAVGINAALIGYHYAEALIAKLDAPAESKLLAIQLLNEALVVTGHGQVNDIFNEVAENVNEQSVDNVLEWKTAHYTFLNPLQFGMALAGAEQCLLDSIQPYCMHAGRAFQITDDMLGTFGNELEAGKSPMDDVKEGKRTLLVISALAQANARERTLLKQALGNEHLTQDEFATYKSILESTGAVKKSQEQTKHHITEALTSLDDVPEIFQPTAVEFLRVLVSSLATRKS